MKFWIYLLVGFAVMLLQSCAVAPPHPSSPPIAPKPRPAEPVFAPPPVTTTAPLELPRPQAPVRIPGEREVIGAMPGAQPAPTEQSPVIVSLLDQADLYSAQGELARAAASVERGLRIEPRNSRLWSRLAHIRLDQQRYSQAESLAKKSNRFAAGNYSLLTMNWRLIANARNLRGDKKGANQAREKASQYR